MGIDGWLYLAIGDYGMFRAEANDGSIVHLHGGGVLRVRPDGSELEIFVRNTRNIVDVAFAMDRQGWLYPRVAADGEQVSPPQFDTGHDRPNFWDRVSRRLLSTGMRNRIIGMLHRDKVIKGLLHAQRALDDIPGITVDFDDLIGDEHSLTEALEAFYPSQIREPLGYIDDEFRERQQQTLARRELPAYRKLGSRVERIAASLTR